MNLLVQASDVDLVSALHHQEVLDEATTPRTYDLLLVIFVTAAAIGTYHNCIYFILRAIFPTSFQKNQPVFKKGAYHATKLTFNLMLSLYGIYTFYFSVPQMDTVPITERIRGFPEFAIFGALQTGLNLWSLPVGLMMKERPAMIAHHVTVLFVGSSSCLSVNGFRYHAPFFFAVIEISSVPLSIMNFCKEEKELMTKNFPTLCTVIRPVFAIIFLIVRVILWLPQIIDVLRISGLLCYTCPSGDHMCRMALGGFWMSALFLTLLQCHWGLLVVKGLLRLVMGTSSSGGKSHSKKVVD